LPAFRRRRRPSGSEADDVALVASTLGGAAEEKYRTVITRYHLQGRQDEEIAGVFDVPLGTVKTHLFRAKELRRTRLAASRAEERVFSEPVTLAWPAAGLSTAFWLSLVTFVPPRSPFHSGRR
jgi:hypothetical protein